MPAVIIHDTELSTFGVTYFGRLVLVVFLHLVPYLEDDFVHLWADVVQLVLHPLGAGL